MFSWLSIHQEASKRVLQYAEKQEQLIALLKEMEQRGLNVVPLTDRAADGVDQPLAEIDPFTFFATFNRGLKDQNRVNNWAFLKESWGLAAELPRDFDGIPVLHPQNAWFFSYRYRREQNDISSLWELARVLIEQGWNAVPAQLFDRCMAIRSIGLSKLTTGMYWLAPRECLPLASTTVEYLKGKNLWHDVTDKASFDALLAKVRSYLSPDFVQESHNAWRYARSESRSSFVFDETAKEKLWKRFAGKYPDFVDFSHPGTRFSGDETDYKRRGLQRFSELGGREEVVKLLKKGDPKAAVQILQNSITLNIVSFQSWRPSIGSDRPEVLSEVLQAFLDVTETPYHGFDTLLPVFNAIKRHGLSPAWDTMSALLWALRPSDYFPIKISYYRDLAESVGFQLESGRPTPGRFDQVLQFGRAFWEVAAEKEAKDWVDVQSFMWALCGSAERQEPEDTTASIVAEERPPVSPTNLPAPKNIWQIAPGENARHWQDFYDEGILAIGWDFLSDLTRFKTRAEIEKALQVHDQSSGRRYNDAGCCWEFVNVMQPGDVVIAKQGRYKLLGIGRVISAYEHRPERNEYHHVRRVQWIRKGTWEIDSSMTVKTLTNITPYSDFVQRVLTTLDEPGLFRELYGSSEGAGTDEPATAPSMDLEAEVEDFDRPAALRSLFMSEQHFDGIVEQLRRKKNVILNGPPGVGKTFVAETLAYALMGKVDRDRVQMVQFHQSYGYEEFIQGLRPMPTGAFRIREGVFLTFCQRAAADNRPWVFIIDEINRGNLSKIFGELLMLIEADKRESRYAMPLAYDDPGKPRFFVPPNVHVIGLMNTADRSLAMVDYALRRRFAFVPLRPEIGSPKFKTHLLEQNVPEALADVLISSLLRLNDKIRQDDADLGEGFCIGHSYFCPSTAVVDAKAWLLSVLEYEVKPLLAEYWMEKHDQAENEIAEIRKLLT